MQDPRLTALFAAIDTANASDPGREPGSAEPEALIYGRRMSETLARMIAAPSLALQIAARGQHIERWTSPRASFPPGRAGYLRWRNALKDFHAQRLGEIMRTHGFSDSDIARVGALVRKEQLKRDPEAQMLEDVACVVFLEHYLTPFLAKTEDSKLPDILAKTWRKMSEAGHAEALKLNPPAKVLKLLEEGLAKFSKESDARH